MINCFTVTGWTAVPVASKEIEDVMRMRSGEDARYNALFDSQIKILNLDLLDAPLRNGYIFKYKPLEPDEWQLVKKLRNLLMLYLDGILLCPMGIGNHIDHAICREAVVQLYNQTNVAFYEDLPYAARLGQDQIFAEKTELSSRLAVELQPHCYGLQDCQTDKEHAIRLYQSQMNDDICSEILAHMKAVSGERLWGEARILQQLPDALAC